MHVPPTSPPAILGTTMRRGARSASTESGRTPVLAAALLGAGPAPPEFGTALTLAVVRTPHVIKEQSHG